MLKLFILKKNRISDFHRVVHVKFMQTFIPEEVNFLPKCSFELVKYKADLRGVGIIQNHWIVDYLTVPVT